MQLRYLNNGGEVKSFQLLDNGGEFTIILKSADAVYEEKVEVMSHANISDEDGSPTPYSMHTFYINSRSEAAKRFGSTLLFTCHMLCEFLGKEVKV